MPGDHLGRFEHFLLLALLRLGDDAYGMTIRRELAEHTDRDVAVGAIYTALARLERRGLVQSWLGEPTEERGGKAKRHYRAARRRQACAREDRRGARPPVRRPEKKAEANMTSGEQVTPPRLARWLLRRALAGRTRSAVIGDLDEEFTRFVLPERGLAAARRWYWRQALGSVSACLREPSETVLEPAERLSLRDSLLGDRRGLDPDIRGAVRFCCRNPLLSTTVVLTLALGIGVNTAVFSVLNASYLKTLPIAHPDRLVSIDLKKSGGSFSYSEYQSLRDLPGLHALIAGGRTSTTLGSPLDPARPKERVVIEMVSANYFDALGVSGSVRGRFFSEHDGRRDAPPAVVVSDSAWRNRFAADPAIVGRNVRLHGGVFTVVGVAPAGFSGLQIGFSPDFSGPTDSGVDYRRKCGDAWRALLLAGSGWNPRSA